MYDAKQYSKEYRLKNKDVIKRKNNNKTTGRCAAYSMIKGKRVFCIPWITEKDYIKIRTRQINKITKQRYRKTEKGKETDRRNALKYHYRHIEYCKKKSNEYYYINKKYCNKKNKQYCNDNRISINGKQLNRNTAIEPIKPIIQGLITVRKIKKLLKGQQPITEGIDITKKEYDNGQTA
jgi:hypothetical protein